MVKNEKDVGWRFSWLVLGKFMNRPEEDGRLRYNRTRLLTQLKTINLCLEQPVLNTMSSSRLFLVSFSSTNSYGTLRCYQSVPGSIAR
jgi:hypothetical protein